MKYLKSKEFYDEIKLAKEVKNKVDLQSIYLGKWGNEDIEWIVLDRKDGKALLITKYIIDCRPYNEHTEGLVWEFCSLRQWLNSRFYKEAFNNEEKNSIVETLVINKGNSIYYNDGGRNTNDKVYLLSIDEANKYFDSEDMRSTNGTNYAKSVHESLLYVDVDDGNSSFWLRSPGELMTQAAYVSSLGFVINDGEYVGERDIGVRPALWIKYK